MMEIDTFITRSPVPCAFLYGELSERCISGYISRGFFLLFLLWSLLRSRSVVGMQRCKLANHLCHLTESSDSVVQKGISRGFMGSRRVPEAN